MKEIKDTTILIVDDEDILREILVFDFKRKGFNVLEAVNGRDAFQIIKNRPVDVVLTDVRMPSGDGIELLEKIKVLNPETPPVIFISAFGDISPIDAYDKGVEAIFSKPFNRKLLYQTVLKAIESMDTKWNFRPEATWENDFSLEMNFPNINKSIQEKQLNLGRGGIFLASKEMIPFNLSQVSFVLKFDEGPVSMIRGRGVVRWVRSEVNGDQPPGFGIEFESLEPKSVKEIANFLMAHRPRAFIPKI